LNTRSPFHWATIETRAAHARRAAHWRRLRAIAAPLAQIAGGAALAYAFAFGLVGILAEAVIFLGRLLAP
jgi:hypothetical protein